MTVSRLASRRLTSAPAAHRAPPSPPHLIEAAWVGSGPPADDDTPEERAAHMETAREHADGDHTYCGIDCEAVFPSEQLRNGILAKGYPGTRAMLDELLRRARQPAGADTVRQARPPTVEWRVELHVDGTGWIHASEPLTDQAEAAARLDRIRGNSPNLAFRLVRTHTVHTVEEIAP